MTIATAAVASPSTADLLIGVLALLGSVTLIQTSIIAGLSENMNPRRRPKSWIAGALLLPILISITVHTIMTQ